MISRIVALNQSANSKPGFFHPLCQGASPQIGVDYKLRLMRLHRITTCAGVSACVAIAANLWPCLARFVSGDLGRLPTVGVCCGLFPHFGASCSVVALLITMSTTDCAGITHLFLSVWRVLSLASDYIIAVFGGAVKHYLSFNKRGATAFQVLLPRQLFTYFMAACPFGPTGYSGLSLNTNIYIVSPLVSSRSIIKPNFTFSFWPSSAIVLPSKSERLNQSAKPGLVLLLLRGK